MSAIVKCPHCQKDVELGVINMGEPSEVIPTKATAPPPPPPKSVDFKPTDKMPEGKLVNTEQAKK